MELWRNPCLNREYQQGHENQHTREKSSGKSFSCAIYIRQNALINITIPFGFLCFLIVIFCMKVWQNKLHEKCCIMDFLPGLCRVLSYVTLCLFCMIMVLWTE